MLWGHYKAMLVRKDSLHDKVSWQYLMSLQKVCSLRISQSFLNPRSTESAVHGQSLVISFLDPLAVELDNKLASDVISALVMSLRRAWLTFIANRLKERIVI